MNRITVSKFALTLLLTLCIGAGTHAKDPALSLVPVVHMVGDNWCPYNCAPDAPARGYLVDMLEAILGAHYELRYSLEPWTRAVKMADTGERQLLLATTPSTTREVKLSEPIGVDQTCFFIRSESSWRYTKPSDLENLRLGVIQDYNYDGEGPIDQRIARYRKQKNPLLELSYGNDALQSNFRKLAAGRSDVLIENENVGRHTLKLLGLENTIRPAGCISHYLGVLHIGVSRKMKNSDQVLRQINQGVAELRTSGRLAQLLKPYGIADWHTLARK